MEPRTSLAGNAGEMMDLKAFNIEAFTLLGIAMLVTVLRCGVRISSVGCKNLWADDYLVILAAVSLESLSTLHNILNISGYLCYRDGPGIFSWECCLWTGEQLHYGRTASFFTPR